MSIKLMSELWDNKDPRLTGNRLLILLCLADHANDAGVCWPSMQRLADRTRIDRRNVVTNVRDLEAMGYLEITRTSGGVNTYRVIAQPAGSDASITPPVMPASHEPSLNRQFNHHNHQGHKPKSETQKGRVRDAKVVHGRSNSPVESAPITTLPQHPSRHENADYGAICTAYEQVLGIMIDSSYTAQQLWELMDADKYPAAWIIEAMEVAVEANVRNLRYVKGVLRRWRTEGKRTEGKRVERPNTTPSKITFVAPDTEAIL